MYYYYYYYYDEDVPGVMMRKECVDVVIQRDYYCHKNSLVYILYFFIVLYSGRLILDKKNQVSTVAKKDFYLYALIEFSGRDRSRRVSDTHTRTFNAASK